MTPGERVEIPAHLDAWMMGDRFGEIVKRTRTHLHVKMDRSGRTMRLRIETMEEFGQIV